jgi:hypothetical protein
MGFLMLKMGFFIYRCSIAHIFYDFCTILYQNYTFHINFHPFISNSHHFLSNFGHFMSNFRHFISNFGHFISNFGHFISILLSNFCRRDLDRHQCRSRHWRRLRHVCGEKIGPKMAFGGDFTLKNCVLGGFLSVYRPKSLKNDRV